MQKCPLCGSIGDDLVFKFYCSNPLCQNAAPVAGSSLPEDPRTARIKEEVTYILRHLYDVYGLCGETFYQFRNHFYATGGGITFDDADIRLWHPKLTKPDWLVERIAQVI